VGEHSPPHQPCNEFLVLFSQNGTIFRVDTPCRYISIKDELALILAISLNQSWCHQGLTLRGQVCQHACHIIVTLFEIASRAASIEACVKVFLLEWRHGFPCRDLFHPVGGPNGGLHQAST
jgi:hypothetical protein